MPVPAMKASTNPTVRPVQRCHDSTSRCITQRNDFARGDSQTGGAATSEARSLAGIAGSERGIDELVRVRLFDLHLLVGGVELGEHAELLIRRRGRHPAVAGEHGELLL